MLACVQGNIHDVGVRAIADLFELGGWNVVNLGPNVPEDEISRGIRLLGQVVHEHLRDAPPARRETSVHV